MMDLHDLILIFASGVAGFTLHILLEACADQRSKHLRDDWERASKYARECELREAYRAGQESTGYMRIEAPTPWQ